MIGCCCRAHHPNHGRCLECPEHGLSPCPDPNPYRADQTGHAQQLAEVWDALADYVARDGDADFPVNASLASGVRALTHRLRADRNHYDASRRLKDARIREVEQQVFQLREMCHKVRRALLDANGKPIDGIAANAVYLIDQVVPYRR